MPHCVIDCTAEIKNLVSLEKLLKAVHDVSEASNLFELSDIKSRIHVSDLYLVGGVKEEHVHVAIHVLAGRSSEKRMELSKKTLDVLCELLPTVKALTVDVYEMDRDGFSKR